MHSIAQWLTEHDRIALVGHVSPDGDAYGSCLTVCLALRALGKQACVLAPSVPPIYDFLPGQELICQAETFPFCPEAYLYLDVSSVDRAGVPLPPNVPFALIDHHETNAGFAAVQWIDPKAASTGEMVYQLLMHMAAPITSDMAICLYTALSTDTGSFQFSNTTPMTLQATAHLLALGFPIGKYAALLFRRSTLAHTRLLGKALNVMELSADGRMAMTVITRQMMEECCATHADTEGIVNFLNEIRGVQVAALLEEREGCVKASLRSQEAVDVAALARIFGGGGHRLAAGCTINAPTAEAAALLWQRMQEVLG